MLPRGEGDDVVVVAVDNEEEAAVAILAARGVTRSVAAELVATYGAAACREQEGWLTRRPKPSRGTRAGQLTAAIRGGWSAPEEAPGALPASPSGGAPDVLENGAEQRQLYRPVIGREERPPSREELAREREEFVQVKALLLRHSSERSRLSAQGGPAGDVSDQRETARGAE